MTTEAMPPESEPCTRRLLGQKTKAVDRCLTNDSALLRKTVRDVTEGPATDQQKSDGIQNTLVEDNCK